jgi:hypothetical protein
MEENQIRLDAQRAEVCDPVLKVEKKAGLGREKSLTPSALRSNG